ncbi:MAG: hypothetical protein RIS75_768 [Actinomycetota bacterium]|jgi:3-methyladenine DNA glycosylase AlkD
MTAWSTATARRITVALNPQKNAEFAAGMKWYMKDHFEFLGVKTPERRATVKAIIKSNPPTTAADVTDLVDILWAKKYREFHIAGCDLLGMHNSLLNVGHLDSHVRRWITTHSWWDSVDSLGSTVISPIASRDPAALAVMWKWVEDENMWLVRAAIQHQRGFRTKTDLKVLFEMCHRYYTDKRFFIAKAIGWALRDVTAFNPLAVEKFLKEHPDLSAVARREAVRGLERSHLKQGKK